MAHSKQVTQNKSQLFMTKVIILLFSSVRSVGDEDDVIEEVDAKTLRTMTNSIENLAVLFCKNQLTLEGQTSRLLIFVT